MLPRFISVTDFTDPMQVEAMRTMFVKAGGPANRLRLGVGVMTSRKQLNGLPSKWQNVFPKPEEIENIFFVRERALLNVLHYADYDGVDVAENLELLVKVGGHNLDAIQLDMVWPDPGVLMTFRERQADMPIVLQVGAKAMEQVGDSPERVVEHLRMYGTSIDAVLLDKSMGRGLGMDAELLGTYAEQIDAALPKLSLVAAGGLGPDTLDLVKPLLRRFAETSIDAQGKLRPSGSALDPIDWAMAETYVRRAIELY